MFGIQPPASLKFSIPTENYENAINKKHNHYSNPNSPTYNPLTPDLTRLNISTSKFIIISAFQGTEYPFEFCHDFSTALQQSKISIKEQILDFIVSKDGPCSLMMERNACKVFHCGVADLNTVSLDKNNIKRLQSLWSFLQETILPNIIGLLHPLKETFIDFEERKILYTHFRNKVCLRLLKNNKKKIKSLRSMIKILLHSTEKESSLYDEFNRLASIVLDAGDDFTLSECSTDTVQNNLSSVAPNFDEVIKVANDEMLLQHYNDKITPSENVKEVIFVPDDIFEIISMEVSI
uniref:Immunogenic fatty acid and retinol binding protein n=1 Tax=Strongyloides stercoralis TaxID=6248 RepID=A0A0K0EDQ4_STRER